MNCRPNSVQKILLHLRYLQFRPGRYYFHVCCHELVDGMSEAESNYARRVNGAQARGRTIEEVNQAHEKKVMKEINKRLQVILHQASGSGARWETMGLQ